MGALQNRTKYGRGELVHKNLKDLTNCIFDLLCENFLGKVSVANNIITLEFDMAKYLIEIK